MELKINISPDQIQDVVQDWTLTQCITMIDKCMEKIKDLNSIEHDEVKVVKDLKHEYPVKIPKITTIKQYKQWSTDDHDALGEAFKQYKGNITKKRVGILARRFKRTEKAIEIRISKNRNQWNHELIMDNVDSKAKLKSQANSEKNHKESVDKKIQSIVNKSQKQSKKVQKWMTRLHERARKVNKMNPDLNYQQATIIASKELKAERIAQGKHFPNMIHLTKEANKIMEDILKDLVFSPKNSFSFEQAELSLMLKEGFNWNNNVWISMVKDIVQKNKLYTDYFDVVGGFVIGYNGTERFLQFKKRG